MPADLATTGAHDLDQLAHEINRQQQLADDHFRTSIDHALRVGQLLLDAKARVPHGEWLTWLAANTSVSDRTARGYMQLARQRQIGDRSPLGLRDTLRAIAEPRAPGPAPEPPAATTDLGARLRDAGLDRQARDRLRDDRPERSQAERESWQAFDSAREALEREARAARRRDLADDERAAAAERAAASARQTANLMDALAAGLRAASERSTPAG
jgi:hypothetical protein